MKLWLTKLRCLGYTLCQHLSQWSLTKDPGWTLLHCWGVVDPSLVVVEKSNLAMKVQELIAGVLLIAASLSTTTAEYVLNVKIHGFDNPTNRCPLCRNSLSFPPGCCDNFTNFGTCRGEEKCDNAFFYCLKELDSRPDQNPQQTTSCGFQNSNGKVSHQNINGEDIDFTRSRVLELPNPFTLPGIHPQWRGVQLYVDVTDIDGRDPSSNQIVDTFSININETTPIGVFTTPTWYNGSFRYASIKLSFKIECLISHYLRCDTSCVAARSCTCLPGYVGGACELNIDECRNANCPENSRCIDGINSYTCDCFPGFIGEDCVDERTLATTTDTSTTTEEPPTGNHTCNPGFTGPTCGVNINDCDITEACSGRGDCIDGINNYTCVCQTGFTGANCEVSIESSCTRTTCSGNGDCMGTTTNYTCKCLPNYTGINCETRILESMCLGITCSGNGICENRDNRARCVCDADYTGVLCEAKIDNCITANCSKTQECRDGVNSYFCTCKLGYIGENCDKLANQTAADVNGTPVTVYIVPAIGFMLLILAVTIGVIAILFRLHTFRRTHVYEDILAAGKGDITKTPDPTSKIVTHMNKSYNLTGLPVPTKPEVKEAAPALPPLPWEPNHPPSPRHASLQNSKLQETRITRNVNTMPSEDPSFTQSHDSSHVPSPHSDSSTFNVKMQRMSTISGHNMPHLMLNHSTPPNRTMSLQNATRQKGLQRREMFTGRSSSAAMNMGHFEHLELSHSPTHSQGIRSKTNSLQSRRSKHSIRSEWEHPQSRHQFHREHLEVPSASHRTSLHQPHSRYKGQRLRSRSVTIPPGSTHSQRPGLKTPHRRHTSEGSKPPKHLKVLHEATVEEIPNGGLADPNTPSLTHADDIEPPQPKRQYTNHTIITEHDARLQNETSGIDPELNDTESYVNFCARAANTLTPIDDISDASDDVPNESNCPSHLDNLSESDAQPYLIPSSDNTNESECQPYLIPSSAQDSNSESHGIYPDDLSSGNDTYSIEVATCSSEPHYDVDSQFGGSLKRFFEGTHIPKQERTTSFTSPGEFSSQGIYNGHFEDSSGPLSYNDDSPGILFDAHQDVTEQEGFQSSDSFESYSDYEDHVIINKDHVIINEEHVIINRFSSPETHYEKIPD